MKINGENLSNLKEKNSRKSFIKNFIKSCNNLYSYSCYILFSSNCLSSKMKSDYNFIKKF
ncbi:hypothetical protein [Fusobacterium vincentii ATCC 49256]|uniref:Uncharacterized protein n=1 Tax=Fusobacterium vincentii ATCC 49256 TaxID=209882 RepID=Q7P3Z9_FUSVC|nr:hypothetical protein [Fusobacterium vincentii ATCC 49256]